MGWKDLTWGERAAAAGKWLKAFVLKHWLPLCFLVATTIALTAPAPGRAVGGVVVLNNIHLISTLNIIVVFLISGLVLKTDDIMVALKNWHGVVYGVVAILGVTPCLGFALRALPLTPPDFAAGLAVFAAVPTTLGVGEALVHASKGNAALALLLLVGTNALGIFTMPPWLKVLLSGVEGLDVSIEVAPLLYKLLVTVLAPALVGKAARDLIPSVGRFATKYKQYLGMLSAVMLVMIIWQTLSGAQDVLVHQPFIDIFIVICCAIIMHLVYLAFNAVVTLWVIKMPLREAIAATIMSSQKSAPVAVTVINYMTGDVTIQGLMAVPCIVGQLAQIFMGSAFAPHLASWVTRREKAEAEAAAAAAAAAEGPDPEAGEPRSGDSECGKSLSADSGSSGGPGAHDTKAAGGADRGLELAGVADAEPELPPGAGLPVP